MGKTPYRNHPTIELLLFLTIVIKCSTASRGKQGGRKERRAEKKRHSDTDDVKQTGKREKKYKKKKGKIFWMQIFLARGTNPSGREAEMRMGLLSKEMIALPPQSDNHEKLTVPGPPKRNHRRDMCCNRHTTHTHLHAQTDWE